MWHTGIEVFGYEYFYGQTIQRKTPEEFEEMFGRPAVKQVVIGATAMTKQDLEEHLLSEAVSTKYSDQTYHLVNNNCHNFCREVLEFLVEPENQVARDRQLADSAAAAGGSEDPDDVRGWSPEVEEILNNTHTLMSSPSSHLIRGFVENAQGIGTHMLGEALGQQVQQRMQQNMTAIQERQQSQHSGRRNRRRTDGNSNRQQQNQGTQDGAAGAGQIEVGDGDARAALSGFMGLLQNFQGLGQMAQVLEAGATNAGVLASRGSASAPASPSADITEQGGEDGQGDEEEASENAVDGTQSGRSARAAQTNQAERDPADVMLSVGTGLLNVLQNLRSAIHVAAGNLEGENSAAEASSNSNRGSTEAAGTQRQSSYDDRAASTPISGGTVPLRAGVREFLASTFPGTDEAIVQRTVHRILEREGYYSMELLQGVSEIEFTEMGVKRGWAKQLKRAVDIFFE